MKLYLCGIKSYQLDLGIKCTAFTDPHLERTLQGIKRDHNEPQCRDRTPLIRPNLVLMLSRVGHKSYDDTVIRAAFTLAFAAFLRVGEFTYKQVDSELGGAFRNWYLTKSSISLHEGETYMELTLPASKTDPFRHSVRYGAGRGGFSPLRPRRNMGQGVIFWSNPRPLPRPGRVPAHSLDGPHFSPLKLTGARLGNRWGQRRG